MSGTWIDQFWHADSAPGTPAKYRRACRYRAYMPERLANLNLALPLDLAGLVAEAEANIRELDRQAQPALIPLARFLLKAESIASSKVEGVQLGVRELARAEARLDIGEGRVSPSRTPPTRRSSRAAAVQRSKPQVYAAIEQLAAAGVLMSAGKAGRTQVYEAAGLIDLISALESGRAAEEPVS